MAKQKSGKEKKGAKLDENRFGTSSKMVVKEVKEGDRVVGVIASDSRGEYFTVPQVIDTGLADPNRYQIERSIPQDIQKKIDAAEKAEKAEQEAAARKAEADAKKAEAAKKAEQEAASAAPEAEASKE